MAADLSLLFFHRLELKKYICEYADSASGKSSEVTGCSGVCACVCVHVCTT